MTIAVCPDCSERVRIPAGLEGESTVRCPLCGAEYALEQIFRALPPELIVVAGTSSPISSAADGERPLIELDQTPADADGALPAFEMSSPDVSEHRARRASPQSSSALMEIVKIAAGGVIGLTIGQLILWWLPGQWKKDPLKLGPKVSRVIPFVVPVRFHGKLSGVGSSRFQPGNQTTIDAPVAPRRAKPAAAGSPQESRDVASRLGATATQGEDLRPRDSNTGQALPPANSEQRETVQESAPDEAAKTGHDADPVPREPVQVRIGPDLTHQDLLARLDRAQAATTAWNAGDPKGYRGRAALLYRALADLGEALTYMDHQHEKVAKILPRVKALVRGVQQDESKMKMIGKAAAEWMKAKRPHDGVCLSGVVKSVAPRGQLYATQISLTAGGQITLISTVDPSQHAQPGARVLALGTLLEKPQLNLDGFQGEESLVILDGYHLARSEAAH